MKLIDRLDLINYWKYLNTRQKLGVVSNYIVVGTFIFIAVLSITLILTGIAKFLLH